MAEAPAAKKQKMTPTASGEELHTFKWPEDISKLTFEGVFKVDGMLNWARYCRDIWSVFTWSGNVKDVMVMHLEWVKVSLK